MRWIVLVLVPLAVACRQELGDPGVGRNLVFLNAIPAQGGAFLSSTMAVGAETGQLSPRHVDPTSEQIARSEN
jgi:hypothetical protein